MRRRGLEPPRGYPPQGPQPCASTNSATGARWRRHSSARGWFRGLVDFRPTPPLPCANTRSIMPLSTAHRETSVDLTKRQQEIFDFIKKYSAKYGYPPTVRDIGKAVGLASSSTVHAHLAN